MPEAQVVQGNEPAASPPPAPAAPEQAPPAEVAPSDQKPPEQAPGTEPEAKPADANDPKAEKRGQARFERRIAAATRRAAEERARRELLESELERLRPKPEGTADHGAPRPDQFDDVEKYAAAREQWAVKKHTEQQTAAQSQAKAKEFKATVERAWESRIEVGSERYDDWDEVVGQVTPNNPATVAMAQAKNGEDIAYHLGKNLKEAQRIFSLRPFEQIFEIAQLSATLAASPPKAPATSKAPEPIKPLSATKAAAGDEIKDGMSFEQFQKVRNKQLGRTKG